MHKQNQATVLVIGGGGYIGSHTTVALLDAGFAVVVLDNFSTGHRDAIDTRATLVEGSCADAATLQQLFSAHPIDCVVHFAARIEAGLSVKDPTTFYQLNVAAVVTLLGAMAQAGVPRLVYSSSAGVYGDPIQLPIPESHPKNPVSPYARSKWLVEQLLPDYEIAHGLRSCALRYFNAAGADPQARLGERHEPETHLVPLTLRAIAQQTPLNLFGNDYPTADGTCVRDYVHVADLADAHVKAVGYLIGGGKSVALNIGTGSGFSNKEVIAAAERVIGKPAIINQCPRRAGDPASLVADTAQARSVLGWQAKWSALEDIVRHAWAFEKSRHP
jgi:UDP-glucose 4-epimerase